MKSAENILFNNCYVHYITELTAKISAILGNDAAAAKYHADAAKLALAITKAYGDASTGEYVDRLQTHAVMPLISGVATGGGLEAKTWQVLESSIRVGSTVGTQTYPNHLDTGLTGRSKPPLGNRESAQRTLVGGGSEHPISVLSGRQPATF